MMSYSLMAKQERWPEAPLSPQEFLNCSFLAVKTVFHIQGKHGGLYLREAMPRNCQLYITINCIDMETNRLNVIICVFSLVCTHTDLWVIRGPSLPSQSFIRLSGWIKPRGEGKGWGRKVCVYLGQLPCRNRLGRLSARPVRALSPSPTLEGKGQPTNINQAEARNRVDLSSCLKCGKIKGEKVDGGGEPPPWRGHREKGVGSDHLPPSYLLQGLGETPS